MKSSPIPPVLSCVYQTCPFSFLKIICLSKPILPVVCSPHHFQPGLTQLDIRIRFGFLLKSFLAFSLVTMNQQKWLGPEKKSNMHMYIHELYMGKQVTQRIFLRFALMSPGFDSPSRHLCACGFQSKLASVGFSRSSGFPSCI